MSCNRILLYVTKYIQNTHTQNRYKHPINIRYILNVVIKIINLKSELALICVYQINFLMIVVYVGECLEKSGLLFSLKV